MINIHITGEEDLYDRFDADRNTPNPSFISFLSKKYEEKRDDEVMIHSDYPVDEARIKASFQHHLNVELEKNRRQRRHNRLMELYLLLIGLACIVAGILLKDVSTIYLQILSLTAGFAIKEAATVFFMKNPKNSFDRARLMFLKRTKIRVDHRTPA